MEVLSHQEAKKMMREAQMICSLQHGYMVHVSKENPYKKTTFEFPSESTCWLEEHDLGKILKIEVVEQVIRRCKVALVCLAVKVTCGIV